MPTHHREGARCRLQGAQRPPHLPRRHTAQAQHGHGRFPMPQEVHVAGHCERDCTGAQPHCAARCARCDLPLRWTVRGGRLCQPIHYEPRRAH